VERALEAVLMAWIAVRLRTRLRTELGRASNLGMDREVIFSAGTTDLKKVMRVSREMDVTFAQLNWKPSY